MTKYLLIVISVLLPTLSFGLEKHRASVRYNGFFKEFTVDYQRVFPMTESVVDQLQALQKDEFIVYGCDVKIGLLVSNGDFVQVFELSSCVKSDSR